MDGLRCFQGTLALVSLLLLPLAPTLSIFAKAEPFNLSTIPFDEGYNPLFGDGNLVRSPDGKGVRLLLDRFTGVYIILRF